MYAEFTAIIRKSEDGGFWAVCPEVPGANGQGETIDEAKENLKDAIRLILQDRLEEALENLSTDAIKDTIQVA
jgi:predicted RNase H-like HicB family nuclease